MNEEATGTKEDDDSVYDEENLVDVLDTELEEEDDQVGGHERDTLTLLETLNAENEVGPESVLALEALGPSALGLRERELISGDQVGQVAIGVIARLSLSNGNEGSACILRTAFLDQPAWRLGKAPGAQDGSEWGKELQADGVQPDTVVSKIQNGVLEGTQKKGGSLRVCVMVDQ